MSTTNSSPENTPLRNARVGTATLTSAARMGSAGNESTASASASGALRGVWRAVARPRSRYRVTLEGLALIGLMLLVGFSAWQSGTNLIYLIFSTLIGLHLVHGVFVWMNLRRLHVRRLLPRTMTAGQVTESAVRVTNRKRVLSSFSLRVEDYTDRGALAGVGYVTHVGRGGYADVGMRVAFERRGLVTLERTEIVTRFPLGLVERAKVLYQKEELLVVPPVHRVAPEILRTTMDFGESETQHLGTGLEFAGLHEYAAGEDARRIHWPTSARTGRPMSTEFFRDERRSVLIVLVDSLPGEVFQPAEENDFEQAVLVAAALAGHLIATDHEVGMATSDGLVAAGTGAAHLQRMLRGLAVAQLRGGEPMRVPDLREFESVWWLCHRPEGMTAPDVARVINTRHLRLVDGMFVMQSAEVRR